MARYIGGFKRAVVNFKNSLFIMKQKDTYVGSDQYGNKYFERVEDKGHGMRASRYIEEPKNVETHYLPEVPVEWNAWLRGLRKEPPTPEEIEANHKQMLKTKLRAAELEKKYPSKKPLITPRDGVAEDIKSNIKNIAFPEYDDLEVAAGELSEKAKKAK
ncbi:unnamed protein product [Candidula unifasciata]|uniref:NADH dehydrogenase [ubiquinone] 1 alpha subcomplex assembly factor 2 n=1 Tax=Candidula unifasciata TaxID=100452 RepID=A0A8S3YT80_9EUPU|nr:unnamed protein product [Candidula unifasciata]